MQKQSIRSSVRAIIINHNKLLLCKYADSSGEYFICPGGGQKFFEDMHSALKRECLEEINSEIIIGKLLFVRDTMYGNGKNRMHHAAHFFKCDLIDISKLRVGIKPDKSCIGLEWIELSELKNIRIYPSAFKECIHENGTFDEQVYIR